MRGENEFCRICGGELTDEVGCNLRCVKCEVISTAIGTKGSMGVSKPEDCLEQRLLRAEAKIQKLETDLKDVGE